MKKFFIIAFALIVSFASFADERKFDIYGNLSEVSHEEENGAFYSATLHFASKGNLYFAGYIADKKFFFISDSEESYLIPNNKITEVYWRYPINTNELTQLIEEDVTFMVSLINEMKDGNCYKPHTVYENYNNYLAAINRGEDAAYKPATFVSIK